MARQGPGSGMQAMIAWVADAVYSVPQTTHGGWLSGRLPGEGGIS